MLFVLKKNGIKSNLCGNELSFKWSILTTPVHNSKTTENRGTEGCSKLKRSEDMTSSGKNGLNMRTNASPKWDRTKCLEA